LAERIISSRGALEGERKQVTVLFADLKGSMELLADRDPEEARRILDPVLERMMEAVHRYEGTVNQVMGDGIMALFGAPVAHEDHAVRACYAALRMQEAVKRYTDEVRWTLGLPIQIRVGLNSGEVVVRSIGSDLRMDYTAIGQTTHLAARMEQVATPGAILLAPDTLRLVEGYVQVKPLGRMEIKGLATPVEVYEALGVGMARTRLQAAAARGLTRFVGRDAELDALRAAAARAAAGRGQAVASVGEPGVGKSRLFHEFIHSHHTAGWLVLESSSVSYGQATAYLPVIDLLKAYFGVESQDDARRGREKVLGKVLSLDEALRPLLPPLLTLLDVPLDDAAWVALEPPQRRQQTLDAVKRVLLRESQEQPLLLVFEDLHWIDAETQALLDRLIESLPTARVLLLVNYRPEYQHGWGSKTYYTQLRLDPLPPASAEALLQGLLGDDTTLDPLKQLLIDRTEGNPFFLEESVRTLVETAALLGERGAYRQTRPFTSTQVPATVQAVLSARVDRLPPEDKRLLQAAAVVGKNVPYPLLQAIAELPEPALRAGLTRLQAAEFVYELSLFPELEYTFKHALTHEVAYGSVLQGRRVALHARLLDAMERVYPDRLADHVEALAHHAWRGERWDLAVTYLHQAGQRAAARSAHREAVAHFEQALAALQRVPESRAAIEQGIAIRLDLGPVLVQGRTWTAPEVAQTYRDARALCERIGETPYRFPVLWCLSRAYDQQGELARAWQIGEELYAVAERVRDPALLLEAHHSQWSTSTLRGELTTGLAQAQRGVELYDPGEHGHHAAIYGGHDPGICARTTVARLLWLLGYPERALECTRDLLPLAQQLAQPFSVGFALWWLTWIHQLRGDRRPMQERLDRLLHLSTEHGFAQWIPRGTVLHGWLLIENGEREEGLDRLHQGAASLSAGGVMRERAYIDAMLAEALGQAGQPERGLAVIREALSRARGTEERIHQALLHRVHGDLLLQQAHPAEDEAARSYREALTVARRQEAKSLELRAATSLARLWQRQGKTSAARDLLQPILGWFTEGHDTRDLRAAHALLAELA
jgi:class 3 adenylate cyclase/predicted ATPase